MLKLVKKPGLAVEAKVSLLRPLQSMLHWVVASVVLHHLPLAAQEVDTSPAVRDSFSISSAYFENNYANNIDYSQFAMDVETGAGRLVLYGNDKLSDYVNGPVCRIEPIGKPAKHSARSQGLTLGCALVGARVLQNYNIPSTWDLAQSCNLT